MGALSSPRRLRCDRVSCRRGGLSNQTHPSFRTSCGLKLRAANWVGCCAGLPCAAFPSKARRCRLASGANLPAKDATGERFRLTVRGAFPQMRKAPRFYATFRNSAFEKGRAHGLFPHERRWAAHSKKLRRAVPRGSAARGAPPSIPPARLFTSRVPHSKTTSRFSQVRIGPARRHTPRRLAQVSSSSSALASTTYPPLPVSGR